MMYVCTFQVCIYLCEQNLITRAPQGVRVIKCNRFPRQKGGHGPRRSMRGRGNRGQDLALFCGEFLGKNRALYFDVTYKDVKRFR